MSVSKSLLQDLFFRISSSGSILLDLFFRISSSEYPLLIVSETELYRCPNLITTSILPESSLSYHVFRPGLYRFDAQKTYCIQHDLNCHQVKQRLTCEVTCDKSVICTFSLFFAIITCQLLTENNCRLSYEY